MTGMISCCRAAVCQPMLCLHNPLYRLYCTALCCALLCRAARLRGSKDGLAGQVLQDLVVGGSVVQRPGVAPSTMMVPDRVRATELPQFCPQAYVQHEAVEKGMYADFSALQPQPYKVSLHQWRC